MITAFAAFTARLAERDLRARQDLELDRDVLEDVAEPLAFFEALEEAAFDTRAALATSESVALAGRLARFLLIPASF